MLNKIVKFTEYCEIVITHFQMTVQDDEPVFQVEHKGQSKEVTPSKIAEAIYERMLGMLMP